MKQDIEIQVYKICGAYCAYKVPINQDGPYRIPGAELMFSVCGMIQDGDMSSLIKTIKELAKNKQITVINIDNPLGPFDCINPDGSINEQQFKAEPERCRFNFASIIYRAS
ncbi:hypothetical protein ACFLZY_02555 [Patescibacteria group bacterium]